MSGQPADKVIPQAAVRLMTVEDICGQLQVHPATVRRWIEQGLLEAIKLGGNAGYRFTQAAFARFLDSRKVTGAA